MSALVVTAVLVAGAIGALLRFGVSVVFATRSRFPWAVLVVNVVGSALGGSILALSERLVVSADWRLILVTGVAGGLTTFSTWSVETVQLVQSGRWRAALGSVGLNLVLGIAAASVAYVLLR